MKFSILILGFAFFLVSGDAKSYESAETDVGKAVAAWTGKSQDKWVSAIAGVCDSKLDCLRFAALAYEETRFEEWATEQLCNDEKWRREHKKDKTCDSGKAFGPWQVQDERFRGCFT